MQTTTDLFSRTTCNDIYDITPLVSETTDESFNTGSGYNLTTSTFLDISRCHLLTDKSFNRLNEFANLVYLDISYTNIKSMAGIADNCLSVKCLNLAGVNLSSYAAVGHMVGLELLSLRCSNFTDTALLCSLYVLRSLDLGQTFITTIVPLAVLNKRLEELAIDETALSTDASSVDRDFKALIAMQSLRLVNVCKSSLEAKSADIVNSFPTEFCLETEIRRYQYIKAICDHDDATFYRLFSNGANIDQLITNGPFIAELWETHCKRARQQTPFYLCPDGINCPETDVCYITSLHIAMLFGNVRATKVIYNRTGNFFRITNHYVNDDSRYITRSGEKQTNEFIEQTRFRKNATNIIFCEVKVGKGERGILKLVKDEDRPTKLVKNDFQLPQLPVAIYESNAMRLTTKMIDKKVYNWKALCMGIYQEYAFLLDPNYWVKKLAKKKGEKGENGDEEDDEEEDEEEDEDDGIVDVDQLASLGGEESLGNDAPKKGELEGGGGHDGDIDRLLIHGEDTNLAAGGREVKDGGGSDATTASGGGAYSNTTVEAPMDDDGKPINKKKKMKMIDKILPFKPPVFSWREHAMVAKIACSPLVYRSTVSNIEVGVLGKRSYWLESRRHWLETRFDKEEELINYDKSKWSKLSKEKQMIVKNSLTFHYPFKAKIPPYYKPKEDNVSITGKMEAVQRTIFEKNNLAFKMANLRLKLETGDTIDDNASQASFESV